jgi:hypothetical protein
MTDHQNCSADIVERLRTMAQYLPEQRSIFREAASEIERLSRAPAQSAPVNAAALTESLIQAAVDYEAGRIGRPALSAARAAVEAAIAQPPAAPVEKPAGCVCQDQHRLGYCTEAGCSNSVHSSSAGSDWQSIAQGVKERIAEGDGFWKSCSGCYETEDGQNVHGYPYSPVFGCDLGNGCSECGGIGAVWDSTDYGQMADEMHAEMIAEESAKVSGGEPQTASMRDALESIAARKVVIHGDRLVCQVCGYKSVEPHTEERHAPNCARQVARAALALSRPEPRTGEA